MKVECRELKKKLTLIFFFLNCISAYAMIIWLFVDLWIIYLENREIILIKLVTDALGKCYKYNFFLFQKFHFDEIGPVLYYLYTYSFHGFYQFIIMGLQISLFSCHRSLMRRQLIQHYCFNIMTIVKTVVNKTTFQMQEKMKVIYH